ncbi:MAG: hypothetical protein JW885_01735 [Deltaproteobacteria bacterium]|nr:hypothetical protein [Candidatus Zymogenaceae bacterium]
MWIYKIIIVNDRLTDNIEEYIGQGWKVTAVNFIPSGSSLHYGPYFRMGLDLSDSQ